MELYDVHGASIAVISDFAIDYVEVHGVKSESTGEPVTESTLFQAASMSKTVSAVAVMSLVQDGVVSLDAEINGYLTSWTLPDNSLQDTEKVTLKRLLSHTAGTTVSGFRGYRYTEPLPTLTQILDGEPPANSPPVRVTFVPGSDWRYSGGGYEVMEQAIRDVTGTSYPDFVRERVLEPVGMSSSTYEQPIPPSMRTSAASGYYADGTPVPGGHHIYPEMAAAALWTTSTDVARFLIELQLSLRGESNRVLSRASTEILLSEVRNHYALGINLWTLHGQPYIGHSAANDGFRGRMVAHMTEGNGVVVLTNSDNGNLLADAVVELIGKREGWTGF
jgi:CubicO group peptidase (beta-lactamase class C family)